MIEWMFQFSDKLSLCPSHHVMLIQAVEPEQRSPLPVTSDRLSHARLVNSQLSSPVSMSSVRACPVDFATVCSDSKDVIVRDHVDR